MSDLGNLNVQPLLEERYPQLVNGVWKTVSLRP